MEEYIMYQNFKKACRILVDVATIIALMLVVFPITVNPVLVTGVLIGIGAASMIWGVIAFENKNR
jgi:hypothetical protein